MARRNTNFEYGWAAVLLVLLVSVAAWAGGPPQSDTFYTSRTPHISITNLRGTVIIDGWEKPQVHAIYVIASPRVEIDKEKIPSRGQTEKLQLETHLLNHQLQGQEARVDYTLDVPVGSSLEVRNPQGLVRIERVRGDTWVESVGGEIDVVDSKGDVVAHSVGGIIQITRPSGSVEASSVTGNVSFVSPSSDRIRASTTSGRILYEGTMAPAGEYVLSSYNGDISILCPPSASFDLTARSVRGKLINELQLAKRSHHPSVSFYGNSLFGTHNEGAATLELTSYSGSIRIEPEPHQ
ncbi:MAG: DUF4097 family beta strand repeat-containing protein [Terriglobia bacterium]